MRGSAGRAHLPAIQAPPKPVIDAYYSGFAPEVSTFLSIAGGGWHIDNGVDCIRLILGGVFDRFPALQIIVGHHLEILSWMAWRVDYGFPLKKNGGLKRTIKEYLRENFYRAIDISFATSASLIDNSITRHHAVMTFHPRPANQRPGYKAMESE
jgi:hypothetical protein